jgi:hypothetical protein
VVANRTVADYYAELQVNPSADREVIDAAYRQLMKKYHPDRAGGDPARVAIHHQRAKTINEAYSVLRDPAQRQMYDDARRFGYAPPADRPPPSPPEAGGRETTSSPTAPPSSYGAAWAPPNEAESLLSATVRAPFGGLAAVWYMLPGPYEWESGRHKEQLTACLLPPLGVGAFALATGRLAPLIGHSSSATLFAWVVLLLCSIPTWRSLLRVIMAALPSVVLFSGILDPFLRQANTPIWLAWLLLGCLSLVLSARLYVFAVLPTLCVCWLLTRLN